MPRKPLPHWRALAAPHCRVVRNGHSIVIAATEIVPGDILLEGGDLVAADARLIQASVSVPTKRHSPENLSHLDRIY